MTDECTIPDEPVYFHPGMYEGLTEAEALAQVGTGIPTMPWEIPVLKPEGQIKGFWKALSSRPRPCGEAMGFIEPRMRKEKNEDAFIPASRYIRVFAFGAGELVA